MFHLVVVNGLNFRYIATFASQLKEAAVYAMHVAYF